MGRPVAIRPLKRFREFAKMWFVIVFTGWTTGRMWQTGDHLVAVVILLAGSWYYFRWVFGPTMAWSKQRG